MEKASRYVVTQFSREPEFLEFITQDNPHIDCLILEQQVALPALLTKLHQGKVLLPTIVLYPPEISLDDLDDLETVYHLAVLKLRLDRLNQLSLSIDQAISQFLQLSASDHTTPAEIRDLPLRSSLTVQQLRLAEKLKERLGYLGVYYKRNPQNFLRHMSQSQRDELIRQLKAEYREVILSYFMDDPKLNDKIDNFVNVAFFADVPVAQIVEMHMELMDEFSKQLKLEGRSDEILLDYRLTLIDTIAHLCEMYRRSIPRES